MKYLKKNLDLLSRHDSDLATRLERISGQSNYEVFPSRSGFPTAKYRFSNQQSLLLHSRYNPIEEAKGILRRFVPEHSRMVGFLGMGLGYQVLEFIKNRPLANESILIFEKELALLRTAFESLDFTPLLQSSGISFLAGKQPNELYQALLKVINENTAHKMYVKSLEVVPHQPSLQIDTDYYSQLMKMLKEVILDVIWAHGNDPDDSLLGLENIIRNMQKIVTQPGIKSMFGQLKDHPAIIVSTGPSLDENLEMLKQLEENAFILAADASLEPLLKHDIEPDFVFSVERTEATVRFYETLPPMPNTWLTVLPLVSPNLFRLFKGPNLIVFRELAHFRWLNLDKGFLRVGPSVANLAFKAAQAMANNPIILVGQDLAYGQDGATHSQYSWLNGNPMDTMKENHSDYYLVPGNSEKMVPTNKRWDMMRKFFETDIYHGSQRVINTSLHGAQIAGTEVMPLEKMADSLRQKRLPNKAEIIRSRLEVPQPIEIAQSKEKLLQQFMETDAFLNRIIQRCRMGEKLVKSYSQKPKTQQLDSVYNKVLQLKENILHKEPLFYMFLLVIVQSFLLKIENELNALCNKNQSIQSLKHEWVLMHDEWFVTMRRLTEKSQERFQWVWKNHFV